MAPFIGPNKNEVLRTLRRHGKGVLEITIGRYTPQFVIRCSGETYELLPLELNGPEADKAGRRWAAEGYFMPEMTWQFLEPGAPVFRETERGAFIAKLESWPQWEELQ
jgi:hypothetical protein